MIEEHECPYCNEQILFDPESTDQYVKCSYCGNQYRTQNALPLAAGTIIKDYRIIRLIGRGGMGEIYLAEQLSMLREVALKVLTKSYFQEKSYLSRFEQEVKTLAKIEHPNIVSAFESGSENGIRFFSMRYIRGDDVDKLIKTKGFFTELEALKTIKEIAVALEYVWNKHKLVHRDVKPANIMITNDNNVKLMDLGISKSMDQEIKTDYTVDGVMVGSPYYVSPEQATGKKDLDFRTDIYSLGGTFFHMITGHLPYERESPMETVAAHIKDPPPNPRRIKKNISLQTIALIKKMMMKKPHDRFDSWHSVINAIENAEHKIKAGKLPQNHREYPKVSIAKKKKRRYTRKQIAKYKIKRTVLVKAIYKSPKKHIFLLFILLAIILSLTFFIVRQKNTHIKNSAAELTYRSALEYISAMNESDESFKIAEKKLLNVKLLGIPDYTARAESALADLRTKCRNWTIKHKKQQALKDLDKLKRKAASLRKKKDFSKALEIWLDYEQNGKFAKELKRYISKAKKSLEHKIEKQQYYEEEQ